MHKLLIIALVATPLAAQGKTDAINPEHMPQLFAYEALPPRSYLMIGVSRGDTLDTLVKCEIISRYVAFEYDINTGVGETTQPIVKVNADGTAWVDWPNVKAAERLFRHIDPNGEGAALSRLLKLRGAAQTLTTAEQDKKELAAGAAITKANCTKGSL